MNEMLSALADGETNEFELRRLLREIEQQTEDQALQKGGEDTLSEQWRRLHVLRSVLRNEVDSEGKSLPAADISAVVAKTIAGEDVDWQQPVDMPLNTKKSLPWRSMAVAASLSVIAVMGIQNYTLDSDEQLLVEKQAGSGVSSQFNTPLGVSGGQLASVKPEPVLPPRDVRGAGNNAHGQLLSASVEGEVAEVESSDIVVEAPN
jgi:sigma-E factor negative regulatory protein RseA